MCASPLVTAPFTPHIRTLKLEANLEFEDWEFDTRGQFQAGQS